MISATRPGRNAMADESAKRGDMVSGDVHDAATMLRRTMPSDYISQTA